MKKIVLTLALLSGLTAASTAQTIVVWGDNFDSDPLGSYGGVAWDFDGGISDAQINIDNDYPEGTNSQNLSITFSGTVGSTLNFGVETQFLPATGNTNTFLNAYTLEFDMAVQGTSMSNYVGYLGASVGLFGNGADIYYPPGGGDAATNPPASWFPAAGSGYQHYSIPLTAMSADNAPLLTPTDSTLAFFIGGYMANVSTANIEEIDIANLQLLMNQTAPPPPKPVLTVQAAKPGLRVFNQDYSATYNQQGFATVDQNQSWVGATKHPVSYSVNFQDFNTVNGYQFQMEMVQNTNAAITPYIVYYGANAFVWSITAESTGFTWSIDWKTNSGAAGQTNHVAGGTNTLPGGVGTWTMTFNSDTTGTVTAPDGIPVPFTLPPSLPSQLANPLDICFGEVANSPGGYGQYFDIGKIAITNVAGGGVNEFDDFTQDSSFNTNLWTPAFSVTSTNAVVEATTNTPYWVNWTVPAINFGLETKGSLTDSTWYLPTYWNGTPLLIPPSQMGPSLIWTLVPKTCLPTVGNVVGGTPLPAGFFQLQNPPTSQ